MADRYIERLLGEKEEILLVTRQHWLVILGDIIIELISSLAILALVSVLFNWVQDARLGWAYLLVILPLLSMLRDFIIWGNHQYIVTNHRVIQTIGVIGKSITDSSLEKVNDVKMTQSMMGRLFNYADIEILTASEVGVNRFSRLGNPIQFKTAMLNAKERLENKPLQIEDSPPEQSIPKLIEQLDGLHRQGILTETEFNAKKAELLAKI